MLTFNFFEVELFGNVFLPIHVSLVFINFTTNPPESIYRNPISVTSDSFSNFCKLVNSNFKI